ncbi:ABC transporter substrate-binding protein [Pseudomonas sp. LRF_L74]|uniref:ABC transporter substrate-binding protein n=1 Tax=Pseudomonas sp. LRF_L74 TaxID=3369422 RepID=UPI003F60B65D
MSTCRSWMAKTVRRYLLLCLPWLPIWLPAAEIVLVADENSPAIEGFRTSLAERRPQDRISFLDGASLEHARPPANARLILLDPDLLPRRMAMPITTPTLVLRISRVHAHALLGNDRPAGITLLWSDPPLERQLLLSHLLLPDSKRIGVLYSEHSRFLLDELQTAAQRLDLQIVARQWSDSRDSQPLQQLLANSDLLLGLDDPALFNLHTIKALLLSSYARQRALIGPTVSFVRAGSLASSYSDQDDWLATLDQLLDQPPARWPRAQYPKVFKVQGNRQVARALGIELGDDSELQRRLEAGEQRP